MVASEPGKETIRVRVDPEEWQQMDDKRHAQRTTWQAVGIKLFREWLHGSGTASGIPQNQNVTGVGNVADQRNKVRADNFAKSEAFKREEGHPWSILSALEEEEIELALATVALFRSEDEDRIEAVRPLLKKYIGALNPANPDGDVKPGGKRKGA